MKYLKIENLIKGILFTIAGFTMIGLAIYGWWNDQLTDGQAATAMAMGVLFSMMRTKLDDIVVAFFKKFFGLEIGQKNKVDADPK